MSIKDVIKTALTKLPLKNIILFESVPDFSDNTIMVYNELVNRGVDKDYQLIWVVHDKESLNNKFYKTVSYDDRKAVLPYYSRAKMMISGNYFLEKKREEQYYLHLSHGAALKSCANTYSLPKFVDKACCFSPFLAKYDAINYNCDESKMIDLGYPRNDLLFNNKIDLKTVFSDAEFDKVIYWLPTYRQHKKGHIHRNISMPIIYNEAIANQINDTAKANNVLVVIKPHPAQDLSLINSLNLSNLIFIDNSFIENKGIDNYTLLGSVDALISDYSSVYYDYLLVDKPIGITWDDFEEYSKAEGFTVNPSILDGGEKINDVAELNAFIERISNCQDINRIKRNEIKDLVHSNPDNNSTQRVADFIVDKLKKI